MNRYMLFGWGHESNYDPPYGGMNDFIGDFDSIDEAKQAVHLGCDIDGIHYENDYGHIFDLEERAFVAYFQSEAILIRFGSKVKGGWVDGERSRTSPARRN